MSAKVQCIPGRCHSGNGDRKRSVEDLEQTIRLLQKLRFEPNGIRSSIHKMLEQGSPPGILREQMKHSFRELERLMESIEAGGYYGARSKPMLEEIKTQIMTAGAGAH